MRIDDSKRRIASADFCGNGVPVLACQEIGRQLDLNALQRSEQGFRLAYDFAHIVQPAQAAAKARHVGQRGLCRGAEDNADPVVPHQQVEYIKTGLQQFRWQGLRFVEDDDATHQIVQLATTRSLCREQRLEQLHVGGDDHQRIPVFRGQATLGGFTIGIETAVMLDHGLAEDVAIDAGCLLDDAGVGDGVDDTTLVMMPRVFEGKGHARQRLAAACGDGQAEQARRQRRLLPALVQHVGADLIDRCRIDVSKARHVGVEAGKQIGDAGFMAAFRYFLGRHEGFGVEKVSIDQTREQHAQPQMCSIRVAGNFRQRRKCGRKDVSGNFCQRQDFVMFALTQARGECRPGILVAVPVRQTGVMAGNEIGEDLSGLAQLLHGMNCPGAGVIHPTGTFDVRLFSVISADSANVALKSRGIFSEVVPQACQVGPFSGIKFLGTFAATSGDLAQMIFKRMQRPPAPTSSITILPHMRDEIHSSSRYDWHHATVGKAHQTSHRKQKSALAIRRY